MPKLLDVVYSPADPDVCRLDAFLPESAPNGCCIFFIHGGGWAGGSKESWHAVMEHFVRQGYVCTSATYHLVPGWHFPRQFEDVRTAMAFVRTHASEWGFDPRRMAVFGSSAGGHLAAMLATTQPDDDLGLTTEMSTRETLPAAAVCLCSVLTCHADDRAHEGIPGMVARFLGTTEEESPEVFAAASPIDRVRGKEPPFLMIVGDADKTTPVGQHEDMRNALRRHGVSAQLIVLPGVSHGHGYGVTTDAQQQMLAHVGRFLTAVFAPETT